MSQQRGSSSKKKRGGAGGGSSKSRAVGGEGVTSVDPADLYFTHSKIRPTFSCGRPLMVTLESIRNGTITPEDLPIITVMVQGDTMYSLNNRRLYVFKQCRKEGLLTNNEIKVRIKNVPDSRRLKQKFDPTKFSKEAHLMSESSKPPKSPVGGTNLDSEQPLDPQSDDESHLPSE